MIILVTNKKIYSNKFYLVDLTVLKIFFELNLTLIRNL